MRGEEPCAHASTCHVLVTSATLSWNTFSQSSIVVQRRALRGSLSFSGLCSRHLRAHLGLERLAQASQILMAFSLDLWVRRSLASESTHARL